MKAFWRVAVTRIAVLMAFSAWLLPALSSAAAPVDYEVLSHGRFAHVALYRTPAEPKSVAILLSGDGGWTLGVLQMADALRAQGAMVIGVDTPSFLKALDKDDSDCVFADGDLENLSHFVQAYAGLRTYHTPVLVGYSSGASLAYAMLSQAPSGTFAGALALGFCPSLDLKEPMCRGENLRTSKRADGHGVDLVADPKLRDPFIVLQGDIDKVCPLAQAAPFIAKVRGAKMVELPKVGHGYGVEKNWMPQYLDSYRELAAHAEVPLPPPSAVSDLPLIEVPATGHASDSESLAILLSGDGGWAGLDKDVAAALAAHGTPVVGIDSLRYFWKARTPEVLAQDLDRVIAHYLPAWHKQKVWLIGYSQGADVLPAAFNRLNPVTAQRVTQVVTMAIGTKAAFEFHLTNWVGKAGDAPTQPELQRLADDRRLLCIYGADEDDSACAKLSAEHYDVAVLPGGHHFGGDYEKLATLIERHGRRD